MTKRPDEDLLPESAMSDMTRALLGIDPVFPDGIPFASGGVVRPGVVYFDGARDSISREVSPELKNSTTVTINVHAPDPEAVEQVEELVLERTRLFEKRVGELGFIGGESVVTESNPSRDDWVRRQFLEPAVKRATEYLENEISWPALPAGFTESDMPADEPEEDDGIIHCPALSVRGLR